MACLSAQLINSRCPFSKIRVDVIAAALTDVGIRGLQELNGKAHELPLHKSMTKLSKEELVWIVNLAVAVTKEGVAAAPAGPRQKRKAGEVDACSLIEHVASAPHGTESLNIQLCGPAKAVRLLNISEDKLDDWLEESRIAAIAGSCPRSHAEIRSSVRAFAAFALKFRKPSLPPPTELLLSWSCTFRCSRTFLNYVCNLRTACQIAGISTDSMRSGLLQKAARAIDKRRGYVARQPMFIGFETIQLMVKQAARSSTPGAYALAMALLMTYVFLLRLPSECLPVRVASDTATDVLLQAVVSADDESITLRLKRRKNRDGGSTLTRKCWCRSCRETCPVHVLGTFFQRCGAGSSPFASFGAAGVLAALRHWLSALGIQDANKYRTHDIRRGHARDLQRAGSSLWQILQAGEWRSAAFLAYMDKQELECAATLDAHIDESSDDEVECV